MLTRDPKTPITTSGERPPDPTVTEARSQPGLLGALGLTGLILLGADFLESEVVPRLEGSAEPAVLRFAPYSWPALPQPVASSVAPTLPIALAVALLVLYGVLYARGVVVARALRPGPLAFAVILTFTLGFGMVSVAAPPARKADILYYAFQGRMMARGGLNPYAAPPRAFASDPWFPLVSQVWRDLPTGYGPVWLLLSDGVDRVTDTGGPVSASVATILGYRVLFLAATLGTIVALWLILAEVAPERQVAGAVAFAWCPVILVAGFEHNDVVMLFFAALGVLCHLRRWEIPAVVALALSALIKYYTLPLLVGYLIWRWRSTDVPMPRRLIPAVAAIMTGALAFAPFDPLTLVTRFPSYLAASGRVNHVAQLPLEVAIGVTVVLGLMFARIGRSHRLTQVVAVGVAAFLVYLAFFSRDWFSWYLVTAVGLASILGGWWLEASAVAAVVWLTGFHDVEGYLVAVVDGKLGAAPWLGTALLCFVPSVGLVAARWLWQWRQWSDAALLRIGTGFALALLLIVEWPLVTQPNQLPALADLGGGLAPGPVVYGAALEWDDWSWGVTLDQSATTAGPDNLRTLCVTTSQAGGSFYAHHPAFSTRGFGEVDFQVGTTGAQPSALALTLRDAQGRSLTTVQLSGHSQPLPGDESWQQVNVPLKQLNAVDTTVSGLLLQDVVDRPGKTYCVRSLEFR